MRNNLNKKKGRPGTLLAKVVVISTGVFTILLLLFVLCLSFFSEGELHAAYGGALNPGFISDYSNFKVIPELLSIEQYKNTLWMNSDFWYYFWNSVKLSLPIMFATVFVGTIGGYAFARFSFPGRKILLFVFILFMMMPNQVMMPAQFRVLYEMELLNKDISIILPNIFTPFSVYLIYQYARKLPDECFEAARMDGAGELRIFLLIVFPNIKNGIYALIILNLIDTWNMIEQPLVFFSDEYKLPLSAAINQIGSTNNMSLFVSCVIFMLPIFFVFMLGKEQLVEGIGQSIVKNE